MRSATGGKKSKAKQERPHTPHEPRLNTVTRRMECIRCKGIMNEWAVNCISAREMEAAYAKASLGGAPVGPVVAMYAGNMMVSNV